MADDKIGLNDFEGQVVVPIAAAANKPNEPLDMWVPLQNKKGKSDKDRGELHIILTLIDPTAPKPSLTPQTDDKNSSGRVSPRSGSAMDWNIPFDELTMLKELGRGQFGIVYKGKWRLQDCAIKVLPKDRMGEKELTEFRSEIVLMGSLRPHRNLVTFLGVSMETDKPLCLVTDFVDGGNLESKYQDPSFPIDWVFILRIARGICAGMHHLHEEGLLHRDLAARNILLSGSLEPMVADFGLSKRVDKLETVGKDHAVQEKGFFQGPYKWMAPESLTNNVFSKKTDVWSYGVTLWEVMARSLPFPEMDIYMAADQITKFGLRLPLAPAWPPKWQALLQECWNVDPSQRPDFPEVSLRLDEIAQEMESFALAASQSQYNRQ